MDIKLVFIIIAVVAFISIAGWAFSEKSEKFVFKSLKLFPRWMKYVGLIWAILSIILPIIFDLMFDGKNVLGLNSANIGLLLICFSKDREEDEMTNIIRLKIFYKSAIIGFSVIMIMDILEVILGGSSFTPTYQLVSVILSTYLVGFYITKSKIRNAQ